MKSFAKSPWSWIPTLYFAEGFPNVIVSVIAIVMYKRLQMSGADGGMDNAEITWWVSWLYLPWVIKPFWSPIVEMFRSNRWWILIMQTLLAVSFAGVAFTIPLEHSVQWTLALFWLAAFASATHDIAADGYYMERLTTHQQTLFVGIRSTFYRISTIVGQGLLLMLAGNLEIYLKNPVKAWSATFFISAIIFALFVVYHNFFLQSSTHPKATTSQDSSRATSLKTILTSFFSKPQIGFALAFMLLYRFPEALLVRVCPLFMLDNVQAGGLALTTSQIGLVQGTVGVVGLTIGGILGGIVVAVGGFRKWLWPMVAAISLPNIVYVYLAYYQPENIFLISSGVFIEQAGYGFGFTAYMLYLLYYSQGENQTAHYAFCTGIMAIGLMLPGTIAGWLQLQIGYLNFFLLIMALCPITVIVSALIKVPSDFGKNKSSEIKTEIS